MTLGLQRTKCGVGLKFVFGVHLSLANGYHFSFSCFSDININFTSSCASFPQFIGGKISRSVPLVLQLFLNNVANHCDHCVLVNVIFIDAEHDKQVNLHKVTLMESVICQPKLKHAHLKSML